MWEAHERIHLIFFSLVVRSLALDTEDPGSIPGLGTLLFVLLPFFPSLSLSSFSFKFYLVTFFFFSCSFPLISLDLLLPLTLPYFPRPTFLMFYTVCCMTTLHLHLSSDSSIHLHFETDGRCFLILPKNIHVL